MNTIRVAILITSHNRREKTLTCLDLLSLQSNKYNNYYKIYLVDDGSLDGTKNAVINNHPNVYIIQGDGSLYWNGGMRKAWSKALEDDYDYYILLNDDVELFGNAIDDLFHALFYIEYKYKNECLCMITGTFKDPITNDRSYGGAIGWPHENPVIPKNIPIEVDLAAGNLLLVSRAIVNAIGILDKKFTHGMGDYDYTLRARKRNIIIATACNYQGFCKANVGVEWLNPRRGFLERWRLLHSPKGPHPLEYFIFAFRHKGFIAILSIFKIYFLMIYSLFNKSN